MMLTRRRVISIFAALAGVVLVAAIAGVLVLRSDWFREQVRTRMIAEIEKASGGRTEVGSFDFDWSTMTAQVKNFALHGKERPGEPVFLKAESVTVGLKIISAFQRQVDIATGIIEKPEFHLIVYDDGTTNIPSPKVHGKGNVIDTIFKIKIRHYEVKQGIVEFKEDRLPLDIRGDNLNAALDWDGITNVYKGHVSSRQLRVATREILPLIGDFDTDLVFEKTGLRFPKLTFAWPKSKVEMAGELRDFTSMHGAFDVRAHVLLSELGDVLRVPIEHRGEADFNGKVTVAFGPKFEYEVTGRVNGRDLAVRINGVEVAAISVSADARVNPAGLRMQNVTAGALGGRFQGSAALPDFKHFEVNGEVTNLAVDQVSRFGTDRKLPWSGTVSGPVKLSGDFAPNRVQNFTARGNLVISQAPGGIPIEGVADVTYDQRAGIVELGSSRISTPNSRLIVSGTLGQSVSVQARTTDFNDVLPAIRFVSDNAPEQFPVKIEAGGSALVNATVDGPLKDPKIRGTAELTRVSYEGRVVDSLTSEFDVSAGQLTARNLNAAQGDIRVSGSGTLSLANWRISDASTIAANGTVGGVDVNKVLTEAGEKLDITGTARATARIEGTVGSPRATGQVAVVKPTAFGEQFDSLDATVRYAGGTLDVTSATLHDGPGRVDFNGTYARSGADWTSGRIRFHAAGNGLKLEQVQHARIGDRLFGGDLAVKLDGTAEVVKKDFNLVTLDSEAAVRSVTLDGSRLGNATVTAKTSNRNLDVKLSGNLRNSRVNGSGQWRLEGDDPGRGELTFTPISFGALQRVAEAAGEKSDLPFQGHMEGKIVVTGPLKNVDKLSADVLLQNIDIEPAASQRLRAGMQTQELVLRNTEPVALVATTKSVTIRRARFTAKDTNLEAEGKVTFDTKSPWDVKLKGDMNMVILQIFNPDLLARGNAVLNASVTGSLNDPQVNGKLELKGASLYLGDITTGVDNANGVVNFDRNRATIERLTAEVGGGRVAFAGFIGFNGGLLLYRIQASGDSIRIRYPEGVSTTINAQLDLTGTSANSLVSGTITVMRAGFTPKADLGGMLAMTAKPVTVPTAPNEYLRNIQFDVRIESGPSLQFQTSLTRDLQAEAELRLRGNAARPALLGTVSVNEGEVNVFGTKYTINRGEIRFLNPTRIEPVFDVDLETKARGITVNISFSGTLTKLNLTYRSDPPLQTSEIVALIAVGRDPSTSAALAGSQMTQNSFLDAGSNALGSALTAPVTSRLQRFFGVSRLKIDPQLTGVENIPQARLTLEQQVSRDITLTYITNLTRTQEQIVRIQWDISKEWSAIAVREENGVFGIDFQYRKRFK